MVEHAIYGRDLPMKVNCFVKFSKEGNMAAEIKNNSSSSRGDVRSEVRTNPTAAKISALQWLQTVALYRFGSAENHAALMSLRERAQNLPASVREIIDPVLEILNQKKDWPLGYDHELSCRLREFEWLSSSIQNSG